MKLQQQLRAHTLDTQTHTSCSTGIYVQIAVFVAHRAGLVDIEACVGKVVSVTDRNNNPREYMV